VEVSILQWIKTGLKAGEASGLSQSGLGRALGLSAQQGSKLVNGDRRVMAKELPIISAYLGRPIPFFGSANQMAPVPLLCDANTSHWHEEVAFGSAIDGMIAATVPAMMSDQFTGLPQFAARITGDALNRKISNGAFAICVSYERARKEPRRGDFVVFEISRNGLHKVMARRLDQGRSGWELQPYSSAKTDKKDTLRLSSDIRHVMGSPEDKVILRGLIIGVYGAI
jgi:hypothetical protein